MKALPTYPDKITSQLQRDTHPSEHYGAARIAQLKDDLAQAIAGQEPMRRELARALGRVFVAVDMAKKALTGEFAFEEVLKHIAAWSPVPARGRANPYTSKCSPDVLRWDIASGCLTREWETRARGTGDEVWTVWCDVGTGPDDHWGLVISAQGASDLLWKVAGQDFDETDAGRIMRVFAAQGGA